jgi:hypothetical protein
MKPAAPTNPKTFLERDNWMRAINASGAPPGVRCLAFAIALHLNVKEGRLDPGHKTLIKDTGISRRSINRIIGWLERTGWLAVKRNGRGNNSSYVLRCAKAMAHHNGAENSDDAPNRAPMMRQTASDDAPHVGTQKERKEKREKKGRKTLSLRSSETRSPGDASRGGKRKRTSDEGRKEEAPAAQAESAVDSAFADFWLVYPKRAAIDKTRKAFAAVIRKHGATVETLIEAAKLYAIAVAGKESRWIKNPSNWLTDGDWRNPPPQGLVRDEAGNVVAIEQPPEPEEETSTDEMLEQLYGPNFRNAYPDWRSS